MEYCFWIGMCIGIIIGICEMCFLALWLIKAYERKHPNTSKDK